MAVPPSGISSPEMTQIMHALQAQKVATLTAAIVAAAGRPHSISEVTEIERDIYWALYPNPGHGRYEAWAKTKDEVLGKVRT